jgi:outer membrane protein OmpA-like peptidoglycan-associated protein
MRKLSYTVLVAGLALAACQTTPPRNGELEQARSAVNSASADPAVSTAAALELQRARDALAAADRAWQAGDRDETRTLAYVARQRATIASEVGTRYSTEQALRQTQAERERIRAEARTQEAQLAEQRAREATQQAANAQSQVANAQAQADAERRRADAQQLQLRQERERAQRMQQDLTELQAKSTDHGVVVTLQDVLFDAGQARLRGGGVHSLERLADVLKKYPERRVMVEGFTDSQGSEQYNMDLAQRRADAVKQQLESLGIGDSRVQTRSYGEAYPVADNGTAAGRQQNRRVEIVFSDSNGKFATR